MEKILTLEFDSKNELLELHLNDAGIEELVAQLTTLKRGEKNDHAHLMTKEWGGNELSSEKLNIDEQVSKLNHLKLIYWND